MFAYILILFAIIMRLVPHIPDVTPLTGLALFGGAYLSRKQSLIIPLAALFISDLFLPGEPLVTRLSVYASFILVSLIGWWLRSNKRLGSIVLASLVGSVVFYLITNLALFYPTTMYTHSWSGVLLSYYNALPFFRNALVGDLVYTGFLFSAYSIALRSQPTLVLEKQEEIK
jgi:hypothetical protein